MAPQGLPPGTIAHRSDRVLAERLRDEMLILDPVNERYLRLNGTGMRVWEALSEPASVASLGRTVAKEFGIDEDRARADVATFLQSLETRGIVRLERPY
jgi:hypothetical protein